MFYSESTYWTWKTRVKSALKTSRAQDGTFGVEHTCGADGRTWSRLFATVQKNHIEVGFWYGLLFVSSRWLCSKRYWLFYRSSIKLNLLPDGDRNSLDLHHRYGQGQVLDSSRLVPQVIRARSLKMRGSKLLHVAIADSLLYYPYPICMNFNIIT